MRKFKKVSVKLIASLIAVIILISPINVLELIIKPLPKKAPIFRCFFPLFTLFSAHLF